VRDRCQAFEANIVLIEDKAAGTQLIQELIRNGLHAVSATSRSRQDHAQAGQTAMIENGFVHLPKEGHGSPIPARADSAAPVITMTLSRLAWFSRSTADTPTVSDSRVESIRVGPRQPQSNYQFGARIN
jgi:phage terminase large subunit-like protein